MENQAVDRELAQAGELTALGRVREQSQRQRLFRQPRLFEHLIRYVMLFCGLVSILTTIGIVVVLGNESLRFFTTREFGNTNKQLSAAITAEATTLPVKTSGQAILAGQIIRIDDENMRIQEIVDPTTVVVERGVDGTTSAEHAANEAILLGSDASPLEFLTNTVWQPQANEFGVLPLLNATLMSSLIAMLVAVPLGLGSAIYLSEYAAPRVRATLKPILELLAGVPTVVFGFFALSFVTPIFRGVLGQGTVQLYNVASAAVVMGIMIVPIISSMSEDAISAVPRTLREASYGMGATRLETTIKVLLPAALSGLVAAFIVGMSRAVGETMIMTIAAGAGPRLTFNPLQSAETIAGHMVRISTGDLSYNSVDYNSLFALGLTLFAFTLVLNVIASSFTQRFREAYQ